MTRVISVTDVETNTTACIEVVRSDDGLVIRRIVLESEAGSGLPDDVVSALVSYIGLPAIANSNGKHAPQADAVLEDAVPAAPERRWSSSELVAEADVLATAEPELSQQEIATRLGVSDSRLRQARRALRLATESQPRQRGGRQAKFPRPSDEDLVSVVKQVGARPKILAEHYGVPAQTVSNWLFQLRKQRGYDLSRQQ